MATNNDKHDLTLKELTDNVKSQISRGVGVDSTMRQLLRRGWPEASARQFVLRIAHATAEAEGTTPAELEQRYADARSGLQRMWRGLAMLIISVALSVLGLAFAQMAGMILFSGAVILGAFATIITLTGLSQWLENRR